VNRGHAFATSVGVVLLAIFGSLTFLYNVPQGPLRVKADPILSSMDPWLAQNWSFFAPDPPSADIGMLVRFSSFDQIDETRSFVDVTSGGLESTKETLVPPREYRILTSALDLFLSAEDSLVSFHPDAANFEGRLTDRDRLVDDMLDSQQHTSRDEAEICWRAPIAHSRRSALLRETLTASPRDRRCHSAKTRHLCLSTIRTTETLGDQ
jgi:hypothetical protein